MSTYLIGSLSQIDAYLFRLLVFTSILELEVLSSDIHKNYYFDSSNVLSNVALPDILLRKRALK